MQDFGVFSSYQPAANAGTVAYLCSAEGTDWYVLCRTMSSMPGTWAVAHPETGLILAASAHPDRLFPAGLQVYFLPGVDDDALIGRRVLDGRIVDAPPPIPVTITRKQAAMEALERGLLSEDEAVSLTAAGAAPQAIRDAVAGMDAQTRVRLKLALALPTYALADEDVGAVLTILVGVDGVPDFFRAAGAR